MPSYSGNVFPRQNDSKFLFGVQSITSEKSILQSFQGVKLKTKNSHNNVTYTWKNNPSCSSLQIFSQARQYLTKYNAL